MYRIKFFLISLLFCWLGYGQHIKDSLHNMSLETIEQKILASPKKSEAYQVYTNAFFNRAKVENNSLAIGKGFYYLRKTTKEFSKKVQYLDSAIYYTKHLNHEEFPAHFYLAKGSLFYFENEFAIALDNYLLAEKSVKDKQNVFYFDAKYNIGFLQRIIGDYKSAKWSI